MNGDTLKAALYSVSFIALIGTWIWRRWRVRNAKKWPETEATVESGAFEIVKGDTLTLGARLPVFDVSYQVSGKRYSGRFSLLPYSYDFGESIFKMVIGRKLRINYDPLRPEKWYLPDSLIEGYKVEQKTGMEPWYAPKD